MPNAPYLPLQERTASTCTTDQNPETPIAAPTVDLCPEGMLFLDQIFMGDIAPPMESGLRPTVTGTHDSTSDLLQAEPSSQSHFETIPNMEPWINCDMDGAIFVESLQAYFDYAALCLPIMLEDAFWEDYNAGRCSSTLLYALACHGSPFLDLEGKFEIQQRLARKFRENFLETQSSAPSPGLIRLDDLEALALMVDFTYDAHSSMSNPRLNTLFLEHNSLVLMTLQFSKHNDLDTGGSVLLARARERQKLLFWHVFGLDAFHCLDKKTISLIPDSDVGLTEKFLQHEAGGYLDAILALAVIARKILKTLCHAQAKRQGIYPSHVLAAYDQLNHWRQNSCPVHLQRPEEVRSKVDLPEHDQNASTASTKHTRLHRAMLWLLEDNCYMQIENCIDEYGIVRSEDYLKQESIKLRVESECLQASNDVLKVSKWIRMPMDAVTKRSFIEISPIVRNICAGICFWICLRGEKLLPREASKPHEWDASDRRSVREHFEVEDRQRRAGICADMAESLRATVVMASRHKDTYQILQRLDSRIASLRGLMQGGYSDA